VKGRLAGPEAGRLEEVFPAGRPEEVVFPGLGLALDPDGAPAPADVEAVLLLVDVWLEVVVRCWLVGLPAGGALEDLVVEAAAGCPAGGLDPAFGDGASGRRTWPVCQAVLPAGARGAWHTGQDRK
jgi:hypothetical protein